PGSSEMPAQDAFYCHRFSLLYDHRTSSQLLAEPLQFLWELFGIRRDKVILDVVESLDPERGNLVEHCALVWNGVEQDDVKGRDAIRGDKEKRLAEIKDFAHFPAAHFFYPG